MAVLHSKSARVVVTALTTVALTAAGLGASGAAHAARTVKPIPAITGHVLAATLATPPDTALCQTDFGINCYSPLQYRVAYNLNALYAKGTTGKGRTIAIVDSFGSPTIVNDVHVWDQNYGLPDPLITIIQPAGQVPPFDPTNADMTGWATETTLDVEMAHAVAPAAKILLVETPVAETEGVTGFPEIVKAENYVINHHLADVITQSFGATEETFPNAQTLLGLRSAYINAASKGITVLASSGDTGATNDELDGNTLYPYAVNSWPSSDPLVTSVGGTQLNLDAVGNKISPDVVWNDGFGAGGGGLSSVFARPNFQNSVKSVVGASRGTPDISMSAAVNGGAILYYSFDPTRVGWHIVGGTSEASPLFSGIVALAAQVAGSRLGDINAELYAMNRKPAAGIVDVTSGNNSFGGVTGYTAGPGYDLASGIGTVNAAKFVPELANAFQNQQQ